MSINIQKRRVGADVIVLGLAGRITLGLECQEVEWQVEDLLKEHEKKIILDFSELKYLDSTGVGILVMCSGKVKQAGGELSVVGAQGIVEQTLKMTRVDQIVTLYATVEAAAENLTTGSPLGQPERSSESQSGDFVGMHAETRRIGGVVLVTCHGRIGLPAEAQPLRDPILQATGLTSPIPFAFAAYDAFVCATIAWLLASEERIKVRDTLAPVAKQHFGTTGWALLNANCDRAIGDFEFFGIVNGSGGPQWTGLFSQQVSPQAN